MHEKELGDQVCDEGVTMPAGPQEHGQRPEVAVPGREL
jgi:hypothetical protein